MGIHLVELHKIKCVRLEPFLPSSFPFPSPPLRSRPLIAARAHIAL